MTFIAKLHDLSVGTHEEGQPIGPVRIWPNPGMDVLHIETVTPGRVDVRVLDGTGRPVWNVSTNSGSLELGSGSLAPGVHPIEVRTAESRKPLKWSKQ